MTKKFAEDVDSSRFKSYEPIQRTLMFVHDWSGTLEICIACPKQINKEVFRQMEYDPKVCFDYGWITYHHALHKPPNIRTHTMLCKCRTMIKSTATLGNQHYFFVYIASFSNTLCRFKLAIAEEDRLGQEGVVDFGFGSYDQCKASINVVYSIEFLMSLVEIPSDFRYQNFLFSK
ncbi:hypothetical protein BCV71DRAFT_233762 [Rhizopus microsporus]|uniref:Uncharacterized protein n=1 Tax=Rhizopus microsporus TaxID=58291 RepID=A0A1X0S682_RHIZD|nr:hypothetical protein BCV71DRAFT_233762 [Rhizopus microsporus]